MKTALVLYGYYGNRENPECGDRGHEYLQSEVYSRVKPDVYLHSWDTTRAAKILSQYRPKKSVIEPQIDFGQRARGAGIDEDWINDGFDRAHSNMAQCRVPSTLSFLYSRSRALDMVEGDYDCIITCRFDIGHRSRKHHGYNVSQMRFMTYLDMSRNYSAMWVQHNAGYADQWFYGCPDQIKSISRMYDMAMSSFKKDSEYHNWLTSGWPESNARDFRSNERLRAPKNRTRHLRRYPRWEMINNHILHKYCFKKLGLYDKSKFVDQAGKVYGW